MPSGQNWGLAANAAPKRRKASPRGMLRFGVCAAFTAATASWSPLAWPVAKARRAAWRREAEMVVMVCFYLFLFRRWPIWPAIWQFVPLVLIFRWHEP